MGAAVPASLLQAFEQVDIAHAALAKAFASVHEASMVHEAHIAVQSSEPAAVIASSKNTRLMVVEHDDDTVVHLRNPWNQMVADLLLNPWDVCIEIILGKETGAEGEAEEEE